MPTFCPIWSPVLALLASLQPYISSNLSIRGRGHGPLIALFKWDHQGTAQGRAINRRYEKKKYPLSHTLCICPPTRF